MTTLLEFKPSVKLLTFKKTEIIQNCICIQTLVECSFSETLNNICVIYYKIRVISQIKFYLFLKNKNSMKPKKCHYL